MYICRSHTRFLQLCHSGLLSLGLCTFDLDEFQHVVRERGKRNGLDGNIHLLPGLEQQTQLYNRIEFQTFHLLGLERLVGKGEEYHRRRLMSLTGGNTKTVPVIDAK